MINKIKKEIRNNIPNGLTLLNAASGVTSIYLSLIGQFKYAALAMIIAMIFDALDGTVAKKMNLISELGMQLDSLSDAISFGIAPWIFIISITEMNLINLVLGILFICSGIFRLGRYNVTSKKVKGFIGMPITTNGIIIPLLYIAGANMLIYQIVLLVSSVLMISTIKINRIF